jgi:hypothetical protein
MYVEGGIGSGENPRHIMGLSGGKDSTALAIYIKENKPELFDKMEFFFTDTGRELEELYDYLKELEDYLGKPIQYLKAVLNEDETYSYKATDIKDDYVPFDDILFRAFNGYLPSPMARWCTRYLKIQPMEKWIGIDHCVSYVGIRADEPNREGYMKSGKKFKIKTKMPFREDGIEIKDVYSILKRTVGIPPYYKWRTRSGCYFCFYQRRVEYAILFFLYPHLFNHSKEYETTHSDGRNFTWVKDKSLDYVEENAVQIILRYIKKQYKKAPDSYKEGFTLTLDEMISLVEQRKIKEFVDTWDLKRLHDVDGENKDGCTVCAI